MHQERYLELVPLLRVAGGLGLASLGVIAIHQRNICQAGTGSPGLGLSALLHSRCVLHTVLKVGTCRWERVCDQQHRHIGRLRRKGDVAWGATCVGFASLLEFLGSALCPTIEGLTLGPISNGTLLALPHQHADRSIGWR